MVLALQGWLVGSRGSVQPGMMGMICSWIETVPAAALSLVCLLCSVAPQQCLTSGEVWCLGGRVGGSCVVKWVDGWVCGIALLSVLACLDLMFPV